MMEADRPVNVRKLRSWAVLLPAFLAGAGAAALPALWLLGGPGLSQRRPEWLHRPVDWEGGGRVSEARRKELRQRRRDIESQIRAHRERLKRVPRRIGRVRRTVGEALARGGHNSTGWLFRLDDARAIRWNRPVHSEALDALVRFHWHLAAQGIDLVVAPIPPQPWVYAHRLLEDVGPEHEVYPAYVEGLLKLQAAGVEVLDMLDAFRAHDGKYPAMSRRDHHWCGGGLDIAGRLLAERLQRYEFVRRAGPGKACYSYGPDREHTGATLLPRLAGIFGADKLDGMLAECGADGPQLYRPILVKGDPPSLAEIMLVGDSNLLCLPARQYVSMHLGGEVRCEATAGGHNAVVRVFVEALARARPKPRVVVCLMRAAPMTGPGWVSLPVPAWGARAQTDEASLPAGVFRASLRIRRVSRVPDPKRSEYDDALTYSQAEVLNGPRKGRTVVLVQWVMRDRELIPQAAGLRPGQVVDLRLIAYGLAVAQNGAIRTVQAVDDILDLESTRLWALPAGPAEDEQPDEVPQAERLARFLEKYPQADADQDGVLTPEEARAYREKLRSDKPDRSPPTKRRPTASRPSTGAAGPAGPA